MNSDPYAFIVLSEAGNFFHALPVGVISGIIVIIFLLLCSAMISGAEVAFFSISKPLLEALKNSDSRTEKLVANLLNQPKQLLATLLIANNFINVGIVIISTFVTSGIMTAELKSSPVGWVLQVIVVTFLILLIGEVVPKVYATQHSLPFAVVMAYPVLFLRKLFSPVSYLLIMTTAVFDRKLSQKVHQISIDELSHALDLTTEKDQVVHEDHKILQGIVKFGNTDVKQIMKQRLDVKAFEFKVKFDELMEQILAAGYSRAPVYKETFDNIVGIIYIKDLLAHLDKGREYHWQELMRKPFFVPESKKIDDLLREFQQRKIHLAVVVDEYGGMSGIVTLEDVIEEIVGDISDEFDDDELVYSKLDESNYVFEGKISLNNFYRVMDIDGEIFESSKGESDTLAGFILELEGKIPPKNKKITFEDFVFTIESVDSRRIKRIKVTILPPQEKENKAAGNNKSANVLYFLIFLFPCFLISLFLTGCSEDYAPKPRGFFRIDLPAKSYRSFDSNCPFTFDYPVYAKVVPDIEDKDAEPCWLNVDFPGFKGRLHLSYKPLKRRGTGDEGNLNSYMEESRTLINKHIAKADAIDEQRISSPQNKVYGLVYEVSGTGAASPIQFVLTDSVNHFMRAALYFNAVPNNDSLAPVIEFIKQDIGRMIQSFRWK